ncbi:uncharacterized protein F4807DRAFT_435417 [Annulohypoxylon truncatum]|uniref:uncharacterized protein n=1 Tax=Annulohypoxylon truncatum TaxID=327061 RepID=UPI0020085872|nr:uncharacterized protein F4807DRAFT_435417 [Annulohypoxylon truncatum]KAI1207337.1 hypothetical protein F4807DRAFT_435417 [Annulohypoxylon truncatum]
MESTPGTTLPLDDRTWLCGTSSSDLKAVRPLYWLYNVPGAVPAEFINRAQLPLVFAWIERSKQFIESK